MFQPPVTDIYLQDKIKEIRYSDNESNGILNALKWMGNTEITSHRDWIFKIFKNLVKKYIPLPDESPFKEGDTYYDVFNHVTQAVQNRDVPIKQRREVEAWAGSLIDAYLNAQLMKRQNVIWEQSTIPL